MNLHGLMNYVLRLREKRKEAWEMYHKYRGTTPGGSGVGYVTPDNISDCLNEIDILMDSIKDAYHKLGVLRSTRVLPEDIERIVVVEGEAEKMLESMRQWVT